MKGGRFPARRQVYDRGLAGLVAGETEISEIDGARGRLRYRGYPVEELAREATFEQVSYLVLHGELPAPAELGAWDAELKSWREPPAQALAVLDRLPADAHPLALYRSMMTVAACLIPEAENTRVDAQWRRPARILAWTAGLAAAAVRHLRGEGPHPPDPEASFAENFLLQTLGEMPDEEAVRAFEVSLIVQAEHGLHAAALAALTVISTGADLGSAVLAGMGALSGALHGGANQTAFEMLAALDGPEQARRWARERLAEGYRFPGFGHRVYKCPDPRVKVLQPYAERLLRRAGMERLWETWTALRGEVEAALGPRGIFANVDAVTGLLYHPIGLPVSAFPIPFALAIQTGWMAHCLEYIPGGPMIEPGAVYVDSPG